uniref:AMP-dependent synthetase/ligase domain-containing protein n=1 Tax=Timema genevievae TaxID=629358 RepID=A0A7R9K1P1_TIMGE|nr:unnamed protein product [Timema genevievae]
MGTLERQCFQEPASRYIKHLLRVSEVPQVVDHDGLREPSRDNVSKLNTFRPSYWHQPGSEPLSPLTVGQLVDQSADKFGHREALVSLHQNQRLTFQQLREQDALQVNINPANQSAELKYCLNKVGIKALITVDKFKTQRYPELISAIVPEVNSSRAGDIRSEHVPSLKSVIVISEDQFPGSFKYDDVMASGTKEYLQKVRLLQNKIQPDEGCNIYFTSDHKLCIPLPLFHAFAGIVAVLAGFHFGSTSVVPTAGYNADLAVQAIKKEK